MDGMKISTVEVKSLAAYMRAARVLRERIRRGEWIVGQMLPSLSDICREFEMSRNSIRQALQMLEEEGLISQSRGRQAVVTARPTSPQDLPKLVAAINDPEGAPTSINILSSRETPRPPDDLEWSGPLFSSYQHLCKIHSLDGTPYVLNDFFIATEICHTFAGAERHVKIDGLLRQQNKARLTSKRQAISVTHADAEIAHALNCELGEMVITVRRWWWGTGDRLVCASRSQYLSRYFVFEVVEKINGTPRGNKQQR